MAEHEAEVVVIGAGARGTSAAWHLAKAGVDVTLVEKGGITAGTSGATFALVNAMDKEPASYSALSLISANMCIGLADELGVDIEYYRAGGLRLCETEAELPVVLSWMERMKPVEGLTLKLLSQAELRELEPALSHHIYGAVYSDVDGHVNPFKLTAAYADAAKRLGARIMTHTEMKGITVKDGGVHAVVTSNGTIRTKTVVNAAGIGVPDIGKMVGLTIPLGVSRGQVATTEPVPHLFNCAFVGTFQQTANGNVLIGSTNEVVGYTKQVAYQPITRIIQKAVRLVPALREVSGIRLWAGLRPMPVDGLPILGFVPYVKGFIMATGHSGISLAQVTGKIVADLVTTGKSSIPIAEWDFMRFTGYQHAYAVEAYNVFRATHNRPPSPGVAYLASRP